MACSGCGKKARAEQAAINTFKAQADMLTKDYSDLVLVRYVAANIKDVKSLTLTPIQMLERFGKRTYGNMAYGTQRYILKTDYEAYKGGVNSIKLELVNKPKPEVAVKKDIEPEVVIKEEVEAEKVEPEPVSVSNLSAIKGIGAATEKKLNEAGVYTYQQFIETPDDILYDILPFASETTINTMVEQAKSLM
jgi:predicted flap endonuclease-1-like 5' DNA nuclease